MFSAVLGIRANQGGVVREEANIHEFRELLSKLWFVHAVEPRKYHPGLDSSLFCSCCGPRATLVSSVW